MKHNTIKIIIALLAVSIFFAEGVLAVEQGIFPKDPRSGLPPGDLRPVSSVNASSNENNQPTEVVAENLQIIDEKDSTEDNKQQKNNFVSVVFWAVIIIVCVLFLIFILIAMFKHRTE